MAAQESLANPNPPSREASYNLSEIELRHLTSQLIKERPPRSDDALVCYQLEANSKYANIGRTVEREVFEAFFGNDSEQMAEEYGPYEDQSIFFVTIDQATCEPAGVLRVIRNGDSGLKTLNDMETITASDEHLPTLDVQHVSEVHDITSLDECWDVGTVAVRKKFRSTKAQAQQASVQLYRALYVSGLSHGIKHFVSIIDKRPYEKMTNYLGIPFVPMADTPAFSYLGSESSQAVYGDVTKFYDNMNRKRFTVKGLMARRALGPLVKGTQDRTLNL